MKSVCSSARKLMKLFLKLQFRKLPQIALVWRNVFEIKKLLQNICNAIINWNQLLLLRKPERKSFQKMLFFFSGGCYYFTFLIVVAAIIMPFAEVQSQDPECFTGTDSFTGCPTRCPLLPAVPRSGSMWFSQCQSKAKLLKVVWYFQVPCSDLTV